MVFYIIIYIFIIKKMEKEKLGAFMDAVLAIIMTILVLELEKPSAPTFKSNFFSLEYVGRAGESK